MSTFQLAGLNSNLLEQVITKMDGRSYFRLQRTCRDVEEFVRKSRNISVHISQRFVLGDQNDPDDWSSHLYSFYSPEREKNIDIELLHGIRFRGLHTPVWYYCPSHIEAQSFEKGKRYKRYAFCDTLKKNRITSEELVLRTGKCPLDEGVTLINSLQPTKIRLFSRGSTLFEALFQCKTLRDVEVNMDLEGAASTAEKLFSTCQTVRIDVLLEFTDQLNLLQSILQIVHSMSLPKHRQFIFTSSWGEYGLPSKEELEERFRTFKLEVKSIATQHVKAIVDLPPPYPRGSLFVFNISSDTHTAGRSCIICARDPIITR